MAHATVTLIFVINLWYVQWELQVFFVIVKACVFLKLGASLGNLYTHILKLYPQETDHLRRWDKRPIKMLLG